MYHLAVGEERHIGDGAEAVRVRVPAAAVAHLRPEHGLGDVLRVVVVPRAAILQAKLALQVVDAVLLLVARHTRAAVTALILVAGATVGGGHQFAEPALQLRHH